MQRTYNLTPATVNAALRPIRSAIAAIPGAAVEVGQPVRLTVRRHESIEGAYGHTEWQETARWGADAVPVTITIPDAALAAPGWSLVLRREDLGGATAENWLQHREDAAARDAVRAAIPAEVATCEECGKAIRRTQTSVVRETATGRLLQVGGTCEGRYIPATALKILSAFAVVENHLVRTDYDECGPDGRAYAGYLWLADYLAALADLFETSPYRPSSHPNGNPNFEATWRQAWEEVGALAANGKALPEGVLEFLRKAEDTARFFEGDALVSRREAALVCGKVRMAFLTAERDTQPKGECPEGRLTLEGVVVSTKVVETPYGSTLKALLECDGYRVWGTVPSAARWQHQDRVRVKATVTRSPKDPAFGFFARPTMVA